jgi:thioredoxin 1
MQIIDFYAQWCGQCKKIMPIIDELSKEYNVLKVDVETDRDMAIKYNINSLPTILFIKDNKEIGRISGLVSKKMIMDKIKEVRNEF